MKLRIQSRLHDLSASYWFIPTLLAFGAILLALLTSYLDRRLGTTWLESVPWLNVYRPDGARAVLSTIAGSMITVAGVTFSITIAAVSYTTSQFGPRLLSNFMRDRGNQITLGTFIAAFLYCLVILGVVRDADAGWSRDSGQLGAAFVPQLSVLTALGLAVAGVTVLIYFIHHVPASIHISRVIATIGKEFSHKVSTLFPESLGDDGGEPSEEPAFVTSGAAPIHATHSGFVESIDEQDLLRLATEYELVVSVEYRPGDFVGDRRILCYASPAEHVSDEVEAALQEVFEHGDLRTPVQDLAFLAQELVEVACRGLSPGVNDPITAMNCLNWLGAGLGSLARREIPKAQRLDEAGHLRLIVEPMTFSRLCSEVFDALRPYVAADHNATLHCMGVMGELAADLQTDHQRACVGEHLEALVAAAGERLPCTRDQGLVAERGKLIHRLLQNPSLRRSLARSDHWTGGRTADSPGKA